MISPNLNVSIPRMGVYTRHLQVNPTLPSHRLQDYTQQSQSQNGEGELEMKKQTELAQEPRQEEQESTNCAKITLDLEKLFQTYSMQKCLDHSGNYSIVLTTSTAWRRHYGVTTYKSLAQLTASPSTKVNLVS